GVSILPANKTAGALAVFSDASRSFTDRDYANLRLLAGMAEYFLSKRGATLDPQSLFADSSEARMRARFLEELRTTSPQRVIHESGFDSPLAKRTEPVQIKVEDINVPGGSIHAAVSGDQDVPVAIQRTPAFPKKQAQEEPKDPLWKRYASWVVVSRERFMNAFARVHSIAPANWTVLTKALPAFTMLAGMSFFAGLLIASRQPLVVPLVSAAATYAARISPNVRQQLVIQPAIV